MKREAYFVTGALFLAAFAGAAPSQAATGQRCSFDLPWTPSQVMAARNGAWDAADRTGLPPVDRVLDMIAGRAGGNPNAIAALESTAAQVKLAPQTYAERDCTLREAALRARLSQDLAGAGVSLDQLWPPVTRGGR